MGHPQGWCALTQMVLGIGVCLGPVVRAGESMKPVTEEYVLKQWESDRREVPYHSFPSITQAADGSLWLATFIGIARSDGLRFVTYNRRNTPAIAGELVTRVYLDKSGTLWVGSDRGLARYANEQWTSHPWPEDGAKEVVWSLAEDQEGLLWVGTSRRIYRWNGQALTAAPVPPMPVTSEVVETPDFHLVRDTAGPLWLWHQYYLGRWEKNQWVPVHQTTNSSYRGAVAGRIRGLWIAEPDRILKFEGDKCTRVIPRPAGTSGDPVDLLEDSLGGLWMGCYTKGLFLFKPDGSVLRCTGEEGLANNSVLCLFEDEERNIWIGLNGGGLARLRPRSFRSHGETSRSVQSVINSIAGAGPGQLLVATHGSGLLRFEQGQFRGPIVSDERVPFRERGLRPDSWVLSVVRDAQDNVWAGVYGDGLFRIRGGSVESISREQVGGRDIHALFLDSADRLWIGTDSNVACRDSNGFSRYDESKGVPKSRVTGFAEDDTGTVWTCTVSDQVLRLNNDRFAPFEDPALGRIASPSLYRDRRGNLWLGTASQKLARYRNTALFVYGSSQGLPAVAVVSMIDDDDGNLWLGTREGVLRITGSSLEAVAEGKQASLECLLFDRNDGLPTTLCRGEGYFPSSYRDSAGLLWFGTVRGLVEVDPRRIRILNRPFAVWIEELTLDGKTHVLDPDFKRRLTLAPGTKRVGIRYTAGKPGTPEGIQFEYRIEGVDADWIEAGEERRTELQDLRPGPYRFTVRATTKDGLPSRNTAELSFVVAPFLWQTVWFRLALVGGSLLGLAWMGRVLVARRMRLEFERAEKRRVEAHAKDLDAANQVLELRKRELEEALSRVKTLSGLIPICSWCKKVRNDQGYWDRVESYVQQHSHAMFTHGLCPDCAKSHFPQPKPETAAAEDSPPQDGSSSSGEDGTTQNTSTP